ncbi:hypothetical protein Toil_gp33 [Rhodococcus phage Toil]|uniref:Uncharacterized protein n=1 Tax=Rhodococcus phage Toil TaxID=1975614 RepID=A0A1W6DXY2_9VIRU|nr:hypothetical protein KMD62_gp33 [Rhodococcus phage Toil]ARK07716.1 hypothetical protein Toil_gp33 [Rhodococcus phage Toil]
MGSTTFNKDKWQSRYHGTTRISRYADGSQYEDTMTHREALQDIAIMVAAGGVYDTVERTLHEEHDDCTEYAYQIVVRDDEGHSVAHVWFDFE